jgi:antitoxin component YwqK of YwqJK toxin-antitoxin module
MQTSNSLIRTLTAITGAIIFLSGCGESVDARQTQVVNGLIYKRNATDPFTGTLKNYQGMARYATGCEEPTEVPVKDGLFDGKITCTTQGRKSAELAFNEGKKHGNWRVFNDRGEVYIQVGWDNDRRDGIDKLYGPHAINPSEPIRDLVWKNGKQTGTVIDEGSFMVFRYRDGLRDGEQLEYSVHDGSKLYLFKKINFERGQAQGIAQVFDPRGQLVQEETYQHGDRVSVRDVGNPKPAVEAKPRANMTLRECVDGKIAAVHNEQGEDAMIPADMLSEFEANCATELITK